MTVPYKKIEANLTKLYQILHVTEETVRVEVTHNGETESWPMDADWIEGWIEEAQDRIPNDRKRDIFWDRRCLIANAVWKKLRE